MIRMIQGDKTSSMTNLNSVILICACMDGTQSYISFTSGTYIVSNNISCSPWEWGGAYYVAGSFTCTFQRFAICSMHTLRTFVLCYILQEALLGLTSIRLWQWSSSSPTVYSLEWALCLLSFALSSIWCAERKCELQCQQCIIVHTIAQIKAQGVGPIEVATACPPQTISTMIGDELWPDQWLAWLKLVQSVGHEFRYWVVFFLQLPLSSSCVVSKLVHVTHQLA